MKHIQFYPHTPLHEMPSVLTCHENIVSYAGRDSDYIATIGFYMWHSEIGHNEPNSKLKNGFI